MFMEKMATKVEEYFHNNNHLLHNPTGNFHQMLQLLNMENQEAGLWVMRPFFILCLRATPDRKKGQVVMKQALYT